MSKFANGKWAYGTSDRSGFRYRLKDMKKEWNGLMVGPDEYEDKHPQLQPRRKAVDPEALKNARPARKEPPVEVLLVKDSLTTGEQGSAAITVFESGHGRSNGDIVRIRNATGFDGISADNINFASGYVIAVVDADTYVFTAVGAAILGNQKGGGSIASAGPVTVES
jgi:hypothetical protein